jgi:hypothetical protein
MPGEKFEELINFDRKMKESGFHFAIFFSIVCFIFSLFFLETKPLTETEPSVITESSTKTVLSKRTETITRTLSSGKIETVTITEPLKKVNINIGFLMFFSSVFFAIIACLIATRNKINIRDYYRLLRFIRDMDKK